VPDGLRGERTMTTLEAGRTNETLLDLLLRLGSVAPDRIAARPYPGSATEEDLLLPRAEKRLYELVDGTLVEKAMGYYESAVAILLSYFLEAYLGDHRLGIVLGEAGMLRLAPGLVRAPDVSFISWDRFPGGRLVPEPIPALAPDLAVEVLSASNTRAEMERKLQEYFAAGCRLVWYVEPRLRTVRIYTSPSESRVVTEGDVLDGGDVLPGFALSITEWFSRAERPADSSPA
ncbi:MAG: Uma2 family endonuclease, partial [Chloroflexi bacterium]|nr:Uma2 family endonuclease [Chloroflexota bacterium]